MSTEIKAQNSMALASVKAIYEAAEEANNLLDGMQTAAEEAGTTLDGIYADAEQAKTSAESASEYAARALGNLSTVQSVAETLNWITSHGTMTLTTDTALDPSHVYFVADPNGDYTVGGNRYSVVTDPNVADISTYYELSIDESLNNYVATHLVVDSEGLWIIPDTGGNKVLIATGQGSTYTSAGTYIVGKVNDVDTVLAQFTADGTQIGQTGESHLEMDYHSMQLIDAESNAYFYVSDLRKKETVDGSTVLLATLTESEIVTYSDYDSFFTAFHIYSVESVKVNGTAVTWSRVVGNRILLDQPCEIYDTVEVVYKTASQEAKAYTLGKRADGTIGALSLATGKGNIAGGSYSFVGGKDNTANGHYSFVAGEGNKTIYFTQTVIGSYNAIAFRPFIIGNGENDNNRSNALTVAWDGNVEMAIDTTATSGTDKEIYDALVDLGWDSDVIV